MPPFKRSPGITPSERMLAELCDRSFLTLWSYPNLYRSRAKELCDLLVVFGNDVIIFSDKSCAFPNTGDRNLDWCRWYRKSIAKSAKQAQRAEDWLRKCPDRIFLDAKCTERLPLQIPSNDEMRIHHVCIALNALGRAEAELGQPALRISPQTDGDAQRFTIGSVPGARNWVHILDERSLPTLMAELSTTPDFLDYLTKKEAMLDGGLFMFAHSELDLLAYFLWNNREFPNPGAGQFQLQPNLWETVEADERFLAARAENTCSRFWDRLIEHLTGHYLNETLEFGNEMPIEHHEQLVRMMASETRFGRRILTNWILERADIPQGQYRGSLHPSLQDDVAYVLLIGPGNTQERHAEYRRIRLEQLQARCITAKAVHPDRRYIVGIALDRRGTRGQSEDFFYLDTDDWTDEHMTKAEELRQELGYFVKGRTKETRATESEYPGT